MRWPVWELSYLISSTYYFLPPCVSSVLDPLLIDNTFAGENKTGRGVILKGHWVTSIKARSDFHPDRIPGCHA